MKRLFALALAIMLVMSLATTAFAAEDETYTLTINHRTNGHTFKAYKIFNGDQSGNVLSTITWGDGINGTAFLTALKNDEEAIQAPGENNTVVTTTLAELFKDATTAQNVADVVKTFENYGTRLDQFAQIAANYVIADKGVASSATVTKVNDLSYDYTISGLTEGYYLVVDETATNNVGSEDYKTHYIMHLTTSEKINTKGSFSTVTKGVGEELNKTYGEYVAAQLNTTRYFKIEVDLDSELGEFDKYYLKVMDTMSAGIDFLALEEVYIDQVSEDDIPLYDKASGNWVTNKEYKDDDGNVVATVNATPKTYVKPTNTENDNRYLTIEWDDLKTVYSAIAGDDKLVIKYSAKLNENAVIGAEGNENEVKIVFSNGPVSTDHGTSVPDYAYIFSFEMDLLKTDGADGTILPGAEFLLYHYHGTTPYYAIVKDGKATDWTTNSPESIAAEIKAVQDDEELTEEQKETQIAAIEAKPVGTVLTSDENGKIAVEYLDDNIQYWLHETAAPAGYNLLLSDRYFMISPNYVTDTATGKTTYDSATVNVNGATSTILAKSEEAGGNESQIKIYLGTVALKVENTKGNMMPHTGGMGTTLFYVIGSVMVLAAVVLLITKKRMAAEN